MFDFIFKFRAEHEAKDVLFFREMRVNECYRAEQNARAGLDAICKFCFEKCNSDTSNNAVLVQMITEANNLVAFTEKMTDEAAGMYYEAISEYIKFMHKEGKELNCHQVDELLERTELGKNLHFRAIDEAVHYRENREKQDEN